MYGVPLLRRANLPHYDMSEWISEKRYQECKDLKNRFQYFVFVTQQATVFLELAHKPLHE